MVNISLLYFIVMYGLYYWTVFAMSCSYFCKVSGSTPLLYRAVGRKAVKFISKQKEPYKPISWLRSRQSWAHRTINPSVVSVLWRIIANGQRFGQNKGHSFLVIKTKGGMTGERVRFSWSDSHRNAPTFSQKTLTNASNSRKKQAFQNLIRVGAGLSTVVEIKFV